MMDTKKGLSARDVCSIIRNCKDARIAKFVWGDLVINFTNEIIADTITNVVPVDDVTEDVMPDSAPNTPDLEQMKIENPLEWEKLVSMGVGNE